MKRPIGENKRLRGELVEQARSKGLSDEDIARVLCRNVLYKDAREAGHLFIEFLPNIPNVAEFLRIGRSRP